MKNQKTLITVLAFTIVFVTIFLLVSLNNKLPFAGYVALALGSAFTAGFFSFVVWLGFQIKYEPC